MERIKIYTDGACRGNPGRGGWGVFIINGQESKKIFGGKIETTNNEMELTAAIKGLESFNSPTDLDLYTDSKYVMDGINDWIHNWKKNGWKTANKKPVKNIDLWQRLEDAMGSHSIDWHWVKGHAGYADNELVDELARNAIPRKQYNKT